MTLHAAAGTEDTGEVSSNDLLRVLIALAGRIAFPVQTLSKIVGPYASAYNLCTGTQSVASIAKACGVDRSNLRKAILKWEEAGVVFRVGKQELPLALYALTLSSDRIPARAAANNKAVETPDATGGATDG